MTTGGHLTADVCVIGAGPAGIVVAGRLAGGGVDTVVVDHARPGAHGAPMLQSLTEPARALLADLGAADDVAWGARRAETVCVRWDDRVAVPRLSPQVLVDRMAFDPTLRAWALRAGARLVRGRARSVGDGPGRSPVVEVDTAAGPLTIRSGAVVVASGRAGVAGVARRLTGPRTLAVTATVAGELLADVCVEAVADGWVWATRLDDRVQVVAVCDPTPHSALPGVVAELTAAASTMRIDAVGAAVRSQDATTSVGCPPLAPRTHLVGDAALAVDPLSGQGIALAVRSGVQLADALLRDGLGADTPAVVRDHATVADEHHRATSRHLARAATSRSGRFWEARRAG